jgi:hypothetical protein
MIRLLKTIPFIGSLLGIIILIVSFIKWKKIRSEFEKAPDDEVITKYDELKLKRLLALWIMGIFLSITMGGLWLTFKFIIF